MKTKSKITFVVPESFQSELKARIIKDGYGFRGKSRWVCEAIDKLLAINNYPELVNYSDEMQLFEKVETIVIDYKLKITLENAFLKIRQQFPTLEGVQSRIIRTAVLQRLLRGI